MGENDQRPGVAVAHVVLETDRMEESAQLMQTIGMRPIFLGPQVSVPGAARRDTPHPDAQKQNRSGRLPIDLMVDNIHATHERFVSLGLSPSPIEARPAIDHEVFFVREPAGHVITVFSSHVSGKPVRD